MDRRRALLSVALVAATVIVAACGSSSSSKSTANPTTTAASKQGVTISDAWARTSPAAATTGAVYATLVSGADDALVTVSVPTSVAAKTELHETVTSSATPTSMMGETTTTMMDTTTTTMMGSNSTSTTTMGGGEMSMRPVAAIDLPMGKTVTLKPGGYHIMLINLVKPLTAGEKIPVTFTFRHAPAQTLQVEVRAN